MIGEQPRRAKTQNAKDNSHKGDVEGLLPLTNFPNVFHVPCEETIKRLAAVFELKERPIQGWQYRAGKRMVSGAEAEHVQNWKQRKAPPEPVPSVISFYGRHLVASSIQKDS